MRSPHRCPVFLPSVADPKYYALIERCVEPGVCAHTEVFPPGPPHSCMIAAIIKSGGRDGAGVVPPLCPSHSRHTTRIRSAASQAEGSTSVAWGRDADTWEATRYNPHASSSQFSAFGLKFKLLLFFLVFVFDFKIKL